MVKRSQERKRGRVKKPTVDTLLPFNNPNGSQQTKTVLAALDTRLEDIERRSRSRKKRGMLGLRSHVLKRSTSAPSKHVSICPLSGHSLDRSTSNGKSVRFYNGLFSHRVPNTARRSPPPPHIRKSALKSPTSDMHSKTNNKMNPSTSSSRVFEPHPPPPCHHGGCMGAAQPSYHCGFTGNVTPCIHSSHTSFHPNNSVVPFHHGNNSNVGVSSYTNIFQPPYISNWPRSSYSGSKDSWKYDLKLDELKFKYSEYPVLRTHHARSHSLPRENSVTEMGHGYGDSMHTKRAMDSFMNWVGTVPSSQSRIIILPNNTNANSQSIPRYTELFGNTLGGMKSNFNYNYGNYGQFERSRPFLERSTSYQNVAPSKLSHYGVKSDDSSLLDGFKKSRSQFLKYCPSSTTKTLDSYCQAYKTFDFSDDMRFIQRINEARNSPLSHYISQTGISNMKSPSRSLSSEGNGLTDLASDLKTMDICRKALKDQREKEMFLLEKYVYGAERRESPYMKHVTRMASDMHFDKYGGSYRFPCTNNSNRDASLERNTTYRTAQELNGLDNLCVGASSTNLQSGLKRQPEYRSLTDTNVNKEMRCFSQTVFPKSRYHKPSSEDMLIYKYGQEPSVRKILRKYIGSSNNNTREFERSESVMSASKLFDELKFPSIPSSSQSKPTTWSVDHDATRQDRKDVLCTQCLVNKRSKSDTTRVSDLLKDYNHTDCTKDFLSMETGKKVPEERSRNVVSDHMIYRDQVKDCTKDNFSKSYSSSSLRQQDCPSSFNGESSYHRLGSGMGSQHKENVVQNNELGTQKPCSEFKSEFLNICRSCSPTHCPVVNRTSCTCKLCLESTVGQIDDYVNSEANRLINIHNIIYKSTRKLPESYYSAPRFVSRHIQTDKFGSQNEDGFSSNPTVTQ